MKTGITGLLPRQAAGLAAVGLALLPMGPAQANNIRVTNVTLNMRDAGTKTANVVFSLAWDNSWRDGANHLDAAWVFVKFRAPGSNDWEHAILSTNSGNHRPAANSAIAAVPDGRGVFVYSSTNYTGSVSYAQTRLQWWYGSNGYDFAAGAVIEVSVHAIEMVYIPEGPFYLGSGGGEASHFYQYTDGVQTTLPYLVYSETNAITVGATNGNLYYDLSASSGDRTGIISNAFPKGYAAFYCMKYELSQGQYVDFLNELTGTQAGNRYSASSTGYRYTISYGTNYVAGAPDRACNFLSWADGAAYADWAALRPMTELEFEKACRGPAPTVSNEYAWGATNIMPDASRTLSGAEDGTETVTNSAAAGGCNYGNKTHIGGDGGTGPLRAGIFATNNAPRISSGAGYYGVMELSGNLWERPVTVGAPLGRAFMGTLGDGKLSPTGYAENTDWPGAAASGAGSRVGGWNSDASDARVSARAYAADGYTGRGSASGGRAVRGAP